MRRSDSKGGSVKPTASAGAAGLRAAAWNIASADEQGIAGHVRTLADAVPQLVWTCGPDGVIDYYNSQLAEYIGVKRARGGHWQWRPLMHPDDVETTAAAWQVSMLSGEPYEFEHRLRMRDGTYRWHLSRARAARDAHGRVVKWFGTATDIDSNKRIELNGQFLLELDLILNKVTGAEAIKQQAAEQLGKFLDVEHCFFGRVREEAVTVLTEHRRDGSSFVGEHSISTYFTPELRSGFEAGQLLVVNNAASDGRLAQLAANYAAVGVQALVVAPIVHGGRWIGTLTVATTAPRAWHRLEMQLMRDVAARVWPLIERARASDALMHQREQLQLVSDNVPALISYADKECRYQWCNRAYELWFGHPARELVGRPMRDVVGDAAWSVIGPRIRAALNGRQVEYESEVAYSNAGSRWIHAVYTPHRSSDDQVLGVVIMVNDITERKRAESDAVFLMEIGECVRTAASVQQLLANITPLVGRYFSADRCYFAEMFEEEDRWRVSNDFSGELASLAGDHRLSDYPQQLIEDARLARVTFASDVKSDARTADAYERGYAPWGIRAFVCVPLRRGGRWASNLVLTSSAAREWEPREIALIESVAERTWNAVEKLRLDVALRDADRRKDEFLATLAHELRNPLAPLRSALKLMQVAKSGSSETEMARSMMERQLVHMVRLVDDLIDVSRISSGKFDLSSETLALSAVLRHAVETSLPLIEQEGHQLQVQLPVEPLYIDGDIVRLAQVFTNLLSNAAKYTNSGGRIVVTARQDGRYVEVSVSDTGIGIPPEMTPKVFEMFAQLDRSLERSRGGLGVGLSLVKKVVELHGGTVEAKSNGVGQGSEFVVRLPVAPPPTQHALQQSLQQTPQLTPEVSGADGGLTANRRILVVDDNRDAAESMAAVLEAMGNNARWAHDGFEALQVAGEFAPEVMLIDIGMPKMNGYDLAREVRSRAWGADVTLIALTGWSQDSDRKQSEEAGFDVHLTKPADPDALLKVISTERTGR